MQLLVIAPRASVMLKRMDDTAPARDLASASEPDSNALARRIGPGALLLYGVGDMLGAGVYALIGRAAGVMGGAIWLAFAGAMVAAALTGLTYACLGSRYPRAAGVAFVTQRAFKRPALTFAIGLAVTASGLTSMAAASQGFAGYLLGYVSSAEPSKLATAVVALSFIFALTVVNWRGIRESVALTVVCTIVEAAGLLFIIAIGARFWGRVDLLQGPPLSEGGFAALTPMLALQGAVLTFYSFVGFEDIINVSEETRDPARSVPFALLGALGIVTLVYIGVAVTAVSVVPPAQLAAFAKSGQPLVEVARTAAPWFPADAFRLIALFAIANTALVNFVMGSRLIYGMARQGLLPPALGRVHPQRRTPVVAIVVLAVVVCALSLSGDVERLALATSSLLLLSFFVVNAAMLRLKLDPNEPRGAFEVPAFVPALAALVCALLLLSVAFDPARRAALLVSGALLLVIALLYLFARPRQALPEPV